MTGMFGPSRDLVDLARRGLPIGDNDGWIAATALACRMPLVSRNARHFARVPGLMSTSIERASALIALSRVKT